MDDLTVPTQLPIANCRMAIVNRKYAVSVCFVSLDAYPLLSRRQTGVQGGAEIDIYMLSTELTKDKNFKVSLITGDYGQGRVEQIEDVTIYKTADLRNPVAAALSIWKAMSRANADIYFKKGASSIAALVALYCRLHKRNLFLRTAHDIDCDGTYIRENWLRGRAFLWAIRQAAQVFVQKDSNKVSLKETTGVSAIVLPNGHRILKPSSQKRDCILWVGRSAEFKQPQLFMKLAQETPGEQFIMVCQHAKDDNKYDDLVARAKAVSNLKFIKGVPFHEIDSFFQRAKLFINTSTAEGFPNTFIQACKCTTPILSLKINPDRFLDKYQCGMCANSDWDRFVAMLKQLLNTETATRLGNNGRIYAEENHDIKKIIEQYKSIFKKRVSGRFALQ